jgi:cyclophilin family peptidyl-prolyl cis-trans isomerase/HEAT repeat protein
MRRSVLRGVIVAVVIGRVVEAQTPVRPPVLPRPVSSRPAIDPMLGQRLLEAEDARASTAESLRLLIETALRGTGATRVQAIRAIGRLERPMLADTLMPLLRDSSASVRGAAAHAVGQLISGMAVSTMDSIGGSRIVRDVSARLGQFLSLAEKDATVRGALATSIGRAAYTQDVDRRNAQALLLARLMGPRAETVGALRGLDWLWRGRGVLTLDSGDAGAPVRRVAQGRADSALRRWAMQALVSGRAMTVATIDVAQRDGDPQVRRLGVLGLGALRDTTGAGALHAKAIGDASPLVRIEAMKTALRWQGSAGCSSLAAGVRDLHPHVALVAIDAVPASCATTTVPVLDSLARGMSGALSGDALHRALHAIVTLAQIDGARAATPVQVAAGHAAWIARVYAARAAGRLRDGALLLRLASDADDNVREAALDGLISMNHPKTDSVAVGALQRADYQLVLNAAEWIRSKGSATGAATAAMDALERITRERRDTSRDPRLALVRLVAKGGSAAMADRLRVFARDFDPVIAAEAARTVSAWTGATVTAAPSPIPIVSLRESEAQALVGATLRITMASDAGGGTFDVLLDPATAPGTVTRVVRLARAGHYTGRTFHRVVPTFVIQGGSPGANEYMGDGPYLRDEVGPAVHARGTLGISTRGRDTGDAQLFVNLVDNTRLDFQYTVFGRVVKGMEVVDRVLEGDRMERVEVISR